MRSRFVWPVAWILLVPAVLRAQRLEPAPVSFRASDALGVPSNAPALAKRGNYGPEGAIIGGVAMTLAGFWLADRVCRIESVPTMGGSSSGGCSGGTKLAVSGVVAVVGAGLGYLVGSGFPKYVEQ